VQQRKPVLRDEDGNWDIDESAQTKLPPPELNEEMKQMKEQWQKKQE